MSPQDFLVHSRRLADGAGDLLSLPREVAGWEWMSCFVHRLAPGQSLSVHAENEEVAIVLLGGISISEDPNIRFNFAPNGAKTFRAEAIDTENHEFTGEWPVDRCKFG